MPDSPTVYLAGPDVFRPDAAGDTPGAVRVAVA
jgi:nucleoside 2-deoxyribosyltransferase